MEFEVLLQQPEVRRDDQWEQEFFQKVVTAKVEVAKDGVPQTGPDGWPYLHLKSGAQANQPFLQVVEWAAQKGVGLALNTHKMLPDYVFTYGMLWNYAVNRRFVTPAPATKSGAVDIQAGADVLIGAPTEQYLPEFVRQVLREFLSNQGMKEPRIVVVSSKDYRTVDLVFSAQSLNLKEKDFRTMSKALSWFLPLHYSIVIASEQNLRGFVPL